MADFFRVQLGVVSRSEGHSAAKRAAYQSCGRMVDHEGQQFDFTRKAAEHVRTIMLMPQGAPAWARQPESLWQRAALAERRMDAQEARIVDFSMPRAVPAELWEACVRHVYEPFVRMGMAMQVDIHDTSASDGGRNINVHGLAALRAIDGDGLASRKDRSWNDRFRERNGRVIREQFAQRLTEFCRAHGIDYRADARPNCERDLPDPEPELPRWNFEAWKREGEMPEALAGLQEHRRKRRQWEAAQAEEIEAALDLKRMEDRVRERRQRRLASAGAAGVQASKPDRRAAILRAWHETQSWIDAETVVAIASTRFDAKRSCLWIDLRDGGTLVDRGDSIALHGRLTWTAATETAAAAERHGWKEIRVHGDQTYKDAVSVAAMLRGITVLNHALSPRAQAELDRLMAERAASTERREKPDLSRNPNDRHGDRLQRLSSREVYQRITKRRPQADRYPLPDSPEEEIVAPVLKPRFPTLVARRPETKKRDRRRGDREQH